MGQPFTFPPPPPPPPKKDSLPASNSFHSGYPSSYGDNGRRGGSSFSRGRGRGEGPRGRGFSNRGQGDAGLNRGDYRSREIHQDQGGASSFYKNSQGSTYGSQYRQQSFPPQYHGQKRPYSTAFNKPANPLPRTQAAPAVPSFGGDILPMLPPQATPSSLPRKKLQKHNQLGLTPSTNENESSSDEDEEAKLANSTASTTGSNSALYSFEYKGRLSTLQTAADIAAWIAERKKRFPTAAKAEAARKEAEKKRREWEKSKKEKAEAQRLQRLEREKAKQEELRKRALESVRAKKVKDEEKHQTAPEGNTGEEVVTKTAIKTEKLRRKLEKAQRDARKAQEALARIRQESIDTKKPASDKDVPSGLHPKLPRTNTLVTSHAETEDDIKKLKEKLLKDDDDHLLNASDVSSEISLSVDDSDTDSIDDYTSSCGSSSVCDSEADPRSSSDQDSDSGPEELTSKRTAPDRVPPPPRTTTSTSTSKPDASTSNPDHRSQIPCRNMFRSGRCHYGDQCRYSHELPEKMARGRERRKQNDGVGEKQKGRKSLYQVMVEKEVEAERREVVEVILRMGERGMLEELKTTEEGREK